MTTGWLWDTRYAWHDTGYGAAYVPAGGAIQPGLAFAENPLTKTRFRDLVEATPALRDRLVALRARPATTEEVSRVHDAAHLEHLTELDAVGGGDPSNDGSAPMSSGSLAIALLAAGGALVATEAVIRGEVDNAYALVRPPGHHAGPGGARGFCLLSNTALAAEHALAELGARRVAVLDWDVHHGNGTEDAFYDRAEVLTISLHAEELYPAGPGLVEHRGRGAGESTTVNVPLPEGSGEGAYLHALDRVALPAIRGFRPDVILVASGLDASAFDPLGRQLLHSRAYRDMTSAVLAVAREVCDGRVVCIHEGGYSEAYVPFCGVGVLEGLLGGDALLEDPLLDLVAARPAQALQPHQRAAIETAAAALAGSR